MTLARTSKIARPADPGTRFSMCSTNESSGPKSEVRHELVNRQIHVGDDPAQGSGLEVFGAMDRDNDATMVGFTQVNCVAPALTVQHKADGFRDSNNVAGTNRRELCHGAGNQVSRKSRFRRA